MDRAKNNSFVTAFLQGLAVVAFVYVVIFTVAIFKGKGGQEAQLASAKIEIARAPVETQQPVHIETPAPAPEALHPEDQVPAPEPVHTEPAPADHAETPAAAADNKELIETTPQGPMPKRSADGLTPFNAYKKTFVDPGKPVIAIAVLDYGLSENNSKDALKKLPPEISLILNPYSQTPDIWKSLAGAEGHEFWIQMPMENQIYPNREDPGPQALLVHSDFKYNQDKFIWALTRTSGYAGIAGYSDAAFLNAQSVLKTLWNEGYDRGLGYFEINPAGLEGIEMNAIEKTSPYVRNLSIFDESNQSAEQWLKSLELEANNTGYAVGVIRKPYPSILDSVTSWSMTLSSRGLALAPVSALAQVKSDASPAASPAPAPAETHAPAH